MASDVLYSCVNDPNFTIICMFIDQFSDACGINKPHISELCRMLENTTEVEPALEELHIKLLRKIKKTVTLNRWENVLAKFAYSYSNQDAWELERFGYKNSSIVVKLRVLKALLEAQFDRNLKFKGFINALTAAELRSEPIGKDKFGNTYWCLLDQQCSVKIFCENLDDETWKVVASSRDEVVQLIEKLKNNEYSVASAQDVIEDDTSSNSNSSQLDDTSSSKQQAKENSLIIERRVYKRVEGKVQEEKNKMCEDTKQTDNPQNINLATKDEVKKSDLKVELSHERESINDTIEDPDINIKGERSGTDCKSEPYFSEVIEEPTLFVYGLGGGVDNEMGNIKTGDDIKNEVNISKNEIQPESCQKSDANKNSSACSLSDSDKTNEKDLPLKKKIKKNYSINELHAASADNKEVAKDVLEQAESIKLDDECGETESISSGITEHEITKNACSVDSSIKNSYEKSEKKIKEQHRVCSYDQNSENSNPNKEITIPESASCAKILIKDDKFSKTPDCTEIRKSTSCDKLILGHENTSSASEDEHGSSTTIHKPKTSKKISQKMETNSSAACGANASERHTTPEDKLCKKIKRGRKNKSGIGTYILPPDYGFCSTNNSNNSIVPQVQATTVNDHHHRSFVSLEPVNTEEPLTEQTTTTVGNTENQNETESTSEFSGLVSYFSSQQNELNA